MTIEIPVEDLNELQTAKYLLENPGLAAKLTNLIGRPVEKGMKFLPKKWNDRIGDVTRAALLKASNAAIFTMKNEPGKEPSNRTHKTSAAISGAIGGAFGLGAIAVELPISTTIMLRSIADIARSHGESLSDLETKLACLEVFALGGNAKSDDGTESGYYAIRMAMANSISEAIQHLAKKKVNDAGAPALVRLLSEIAKKFGIQVTEKSALQAVPVVGAVSGAIINAVFMDHFQDMARGHFTVRKLERKHGKDMIKKHYLELPKKVKKIKS